MTDPYYIAEDGSPARKDANSNCPTCKGWGIVDDGDNFACVFIACPECIKNDAKETKHEY